MCGSKEISPSPSLDPGECMWLDLDLIARVMKDVQNLFPVARYATASVPTYTSGQIGMVVASKDKVSL